MKDLKSYAGWALITGASSGIGLEFARAIAATGVNCVLVARRIERLESLAQELGEKHGVECRCVQQDLAAEDATVRIVEATRDIPIGILVNNAGFGAPGHFETRDPQRLDELVRVNCLAPVALTRAFLPQMVERNRGALIFVASIVGVVPTPWDTTYSASKAFDLHFAEALWGELRQTGVDTVTICPDATKTEFFEVEGHSPENQKKIFRKAATPEYIVRLTLRNLGKRPTTGPPTFHLAALATRLLPRRAILGLMRLIMRVQMRADQIE